MPSRIPSVRLAASAAILAGAAVPVHGFSADASPRIAGEATPAQLERGREIAFDRGKGNCLACHAIADGPLPGNIGPPLMAMKLRFPDPDGLRDQIWDASARNAETIMPPFGKHQILTDEEIDLVVAYLYSL